MPAPISGTECFLYRVIAWQRSDGKKEWQKAADETLHLPFYIDDTTGQMLVEPLAAELDLDRDVCEEFVTSIFSSADDIPLRVSRFLAGHNVGNDRPLRLEEFLIKPDDSLFITGTLTENPGIEVRPKETVSTLATPSRPGRQKADPAPEIVRLYGGAPTSSATDMTQQGKIAAALMRAGINKPEAWSAAGVPYPSVAIENRAPTASSVQRIGLSGVGVKSDQPKVSSEQSSFNLKPPVVLMKGEADPTFVISCRSQKELISSLAWKSAGFLWTGAAITGVGLYMLMLQLGVSR